MAIDVRHPAAWPSAVASGTPATRAAAIPTNASDVARPACPGGASRDAAGASADQNTPWARAATSRAATSTPNVGAKALASWETVNTTISAASSRSRRRRIVTAVSGIVDSAATAA